MGLSDLVPLANKLKALAIFALLVICALAWLCWEVATASGVDHASKLIVIGICLSGILLIFFFVAVKGKPGIAEQASIDELLLVYFLRGVRHDYLLDRNASDGRINVMQPIEVDGTKKLGIKLMDYRDKYEDRELSHYWRLGYGKCGEAWAEKDQRYYAEGDTSKLAALAPMDTTAGSRSNELKSILSTPILWQGECIGVLNFDSPLPGKETGVSTNSVQALFDQAAKALAPALSLLASKSAKA